MGRVLCLLLMVAGAARGADDWVVLPEPKFMGHKITLPIEGAKGTVLAAAHMGEFGAEFPTEGEWKELGVTDDALAASGRAAASKWLKAVKPEYVRGANQVVEYAVLKSDKFPVCATVLAPEFAKQFEEVLGPKPLVVIPNRFTVFVFPALAGHHQRYVGMVLAAWHSEWPKVSLELFEIGEKGLRAVGAYEED